MSVKRKLVSLLCDFPNVSIAKERQTFIDSVGLTEFSDRIDFEGNTRTFFNSLTNVIARSSDRDGLLNFLDNLISSDWVGIDRVRELESLKAEIQNLSSQQFKSKFIKENPASSLTRQELKNRRDLLSQVKSEVEGRLRQSLHCRMGALINLGKEAQPEQVRRIWDVDVKIGDRPQRPLSRETEIIEVFDDEDVAGRLLILGAPGSGKTTTMLELAAELTRRAEDDPEEPMPVLFNLSSWKDDKQPISEWLVGELNLKYGARKDIGKNWVEGRRLLPMLDGLDELESGRQELCVGAINDLLRGECRPGFLVVCSRLEEYELYQSRLLLNGAVCLQPLTEVQIEGYLEECQRPGLWSTVREDAALLELVRTPLLLSMTVVAEISMAEWGELGSSGERLSYLLDAYVVRMLGEELKSRVYVRAKVPSARQTRFWLIWVAIQMQNKSKSEFFIEKMQPYWLESSGQIFIYLIILWLIYFALFLSILSLFFQLSFELILLVIGFALWLLLNWWMMNLIWGGGFLYAVIFSTLYKLIYWLIIGIFKRLMITEVEIAIIPNQRIWNCWLNLLRITIPTLACNFILSFRELEITTNVCDLLALLTIIFLIVAMIELGQPVIKHFSLRLVLYFTGKIPWNYARFLDYATERTILQRVGGGYRFIHRLLQEHFASLGE